MPMINQTARSPWGEWCCKWFSNNIDYCSYNALCSLYVKERGKVCGGANKIVCVCVYRPCQTPMWVTISQPASQPASPAAHVSHPVHLMETSHTSRPRVPEARKGKKKKRREKGKGKIHRPTHSHWSAICKKSLINHTARSATVLVTGPK